MMTETEETTKVCDKQEVYKTSIDELLKCVAEEENIELFQTILSRRITVENIETWLVKKISIINECYIDEEKGEIKFSHSPEYAQLGKEILDEYKRKWRIIGRE